MKRRPPLDDELADWRRTFATNLRHWMHERFADEANKTLALATKSGVGKSSINRWLNPESNEQRPYSYPTLDKIIKLSRGLSIQPSELILDAAGTRRLLQIRPDTVAEDSGIHLKRR